ncbi:histidine phosphatase superfamily [Suillus ampliporus]|nr:histidine phosphatase superfamily [Suillus ampliporus]
MLIQGLLNWLPLGSLTFDLYKHEDDDPLKRLGYLTPYSIAPASRGVATELPGDYSVNRVMLMHRHGSRGPEFESGLINSLVQTLRNSHDAIQHAHLPKNLCFLKKGYKSHLEPGKLTIVGRQELFDHGVEFGSKYPNFDTDTLLSSDAPRTIDSMYFFGLGRFGRKLEDKELLTFHDMPDPISWITPWTTCPSDWQCRRNGATYTSPKSLRWNELLPDIDLTDDYACAYDLAARDESPWCNVFHADELANFQYELDLGMDVGVGYLAPNDSARVAGSVFVNKLIERFTNTSEEAPSLYLEFGHDATILVAMDLNSYVSMRIASDSVLCIHL